MEPQLSQHKLRGAFFTPDEICKFISRWAIRSNKDTILEPSCGEANFLIHAGRQLMAMGAERSNLYFQLNGTELYEPSIQNAHQLLSKEGFSARLDVGDFFDSLPAPVYDAVLGNPPYIRYQSLHGNARAKSMAIALKYGVRLSGLSSLWAAFVVYASQFLKPSGRLGLVLPAELLSVKYAAQIRRFLLNRFARVQLVTFEELVFPGVLEDVVLLLAEGDGQSKSFELFQARNVRDLLYLKADAGGWTEFVPVEDEKWTAALLSPGAVNIYQSFVEGDFFKPLDSWGETYLGTVTGNNKFFTLTETQVNERGFTEKDVIKISPPGSKHLRGFEFSVKAWRKMSKEGESCFLFFPRGAELSAAAESYISEGESQRIHTTYKCRTRNPWWRVPLVAMPDLFLTYMDHNRPRLVTNTANVFHLNSLYGVKLHDTGSSIGRQMLPIASLNSISLLSAEMVGRSYGGGMLKLEPSEADTLTVPSYGLLQEVSEDLHAITPQLSSALRKSQLTPAVSLVDSIILEKHLGLDKASIRSLREARDFLFNRRARRGRARNDED